MEQHTNTHETRLIADADFCRILLPYEIRLAQRRTMVHDTQNITDRAPSFLGLYHIRVETPKNQSPEGDRGQMNSIDRHIHELMKEALRDSDIPCFLGRNEHLAIARDLDADHAYVVAHRLLGAASRSVVLKMASARVFVGYIVYPLSSPPNFPVHDWESLITLTRKMGERGDPSARSAGFGLLGGPEVRKAGMPEAEVIPVAIDNPDPLIEAEILTLQRINIMP